MEHYQGYTITSQVGAVCVVTVIKDAAGNTVDTIMGMFSEETEAHARRQIRDLVARQEDQK
jgi:hypothetical protein